MSQSNVSHQLKLLKQTHLVKAKRAGQSMIYSLDDQHVATLLNKPFIMQIIQKKVDLIMTNHTHQHHHDHVHGHVHTNNKKYYLFRF